jgi:hypothetical protein
MNRVFGWVVTLLAACLISACANADIKGERASTANPTVALKSVDVIFVDQAAMKKSGLSALRIDSSADAGWMSRAGDELRWVMSDMSEGVVAALAAHSIPGRSYLLSRQSSQVTSSPTHVVAVSMRSAKLASNSPTTFTLNVEIFEGASRQSLWKGSSEIYTGRAGFSKEAQTQSALAKRTKFGEDIVRALQDSGVLPSVPKPI